MFYLAQQLNKESNDFVWWSILGLTDLLVHDKISFPKYQEMVFDLQNHILKLNALDYGKYFMKNFKLGCFRKRK